MRLLVTRPQPDAERTAALLRELRHRVVVAPLLRYERLAPPRLDLSGCAGLLVTSANALLAAAEHPQFAELVGLPLFAVGSRTAEVAREFGFADIRNAAGDATDLVGLIARSVTSPAKLLHLCGADRAADLAGILRKRDIEVHTMVLYRMVPVVHFPCEVVNQLREKTIDGVLHYSRRSAETFVSCAAADDLTSDALTPRHFCLSAPVAEPLTKAGPCEVRIAPHPDEGSLLSLLE
ncbi:MAG: uroporphyrinogen-III synthase [Variibacter sp.]|nr:uroporphyrinogen-III synthase [Variibacter sp.]